MKYLLDTNICIYIIKHHPAGVRARFDACELGDIGVSTISVAELRYGLEKSAAPQKNLAALERFLAPLEFADFDHEATIAYGPIRAALARSGKPIGALDLLIAAQAISRDLVLVTNNVGEFQRVPGLKLENWAVP